MRLVGFLMCLLSLNLLFAQAPKWSWAISSGGIGDEFIVDLAIDSEENILVTGNYFFDDLEICDKPIPNQNFKDIFVCKFNNQGNCIWKRRIVSQFGCDFSFLSTDNKNNVYVSGSFEGNINLDGIKMIGDSFYASAFLIKLNSMGVVEWTKVISGNKNQIVASKLKVDHEQNIYLSGNSDAGIIKVDQIELKSNLNIGINIFVLKFDSEGNTLWGKLIQGNVFAFINDIVIDKKNNFVITGEFYSSLGSDYMIFDSFILHNKSRNFTSDIFLAKINSKGEVLWANSFGEIDSEIGGSLAIDTKNNIYLTGTFDGKRFLIGQDTLYRKRLLFRDYFLAKFDEYCFPTWSISADFSRTPALWYELAVDQKDNVYLHYQFSDSTLIIGNTVFKSKGNVDNLLVAMDQNKNLLWAKSYGSNDYDESYNLKFNNDGDLIVTGGYSGPELILGKDTLINKGRDIGNGTPRNFFIAKLSFDTITNVKYVYTANNIKLYPNPVSDKLTLSSEFLTYDISVINVFDLTGKQYHPKYIINGHKAELFTKGLNPGIYFVQLITNSGMFT